MSRAILDASTDDAYGVGSSVELHVECKFDSTDLPISVDRALSYRYPNVSYDSSSVELSLSECFIRLV